VNISNTDLKKQRLAETIELYISQEGLSYQSLADMLDVSYLKLKRWADGTSFPRPGSDFDNLCETLGLEKSDLLKVPPLRDQLFHSLESLLSDYARLVGDSSARSRTFLLTVSVVYSRLLQLPNTSLLLKNYIGDSSSIDIPTEAVFFTAKPFGLVGSHDCIKYYLYKPDDIDVELRTFTSSVLDSFVK
jgi:hypothetical protein